MTKRTVATWWYLVGLSLITLVLFSNCTTKRAQPAVAPPAPGPLGGVSTSSIPVVPPLRGNPVVGQIFAGVTQRLDGFECSECIFKDVIFEYAGGAYKLHNCTFEGSISFRVTGAAANTVRMLAIARDFAASLPPSDPTSPPAPRMVPIPIPVTGDFISPQ